MFLVDIVSHMSHAHILKRERYFNMESSTYYFHVKAKIFLDFQICISVLLIKILSCRVQKNRSAQYGRWVTADEWVTTDKAITCV